MWSHPNGEGMETIQRFPTFPVAISKGKIVEGTFSLRYSLQAYGHSDIEAT